MASNSNSTDDPMFHICIQETLSSSSVPGAVLGSRINQETGFKKSSPPRAYFISVGRTEREINKYIDMIMSGRRLCRE